MAHNRNSISWRPGLILAVLLTQGFGAMAMPQSGPDANSFEQRQWKAVYQAGVAPFGLDSRISVTIGNGSMVFEGKKGGTFSIPARTITAVSSNLTSEHTATRNQVQAWGGLAQLSPYTLLFLPLGLPVMAATYPVKSRYAYISILWSEENTDEEVRLRLDRKDYKPFLEELQKATGREWKNLETEWEKLQQALAGSTGYRTALRLDRKVRVGAVDLKAGLYQLVLSTREADHGEAYLFPNNEINIEHLLATALVDILPSSTDAQAAAVTYKENGNEVSRISEIRIAGQVLRFP
jgi:hypothetical protein